MSLVLFSRAPILAAACHEGRHDQQGSEALGSLRQRLAPLTIRPHLKQNFPSTTLISINKKQQAERVKLRISSLFPCWHRQTDLILVVSRNHAFDHKHHGPEPTTRIASHINNSLPYLGSGGVGISLILLPPDSPPSFRPQSVFRNLSIRQYTPQGPCDSTCRRRAPCPPSIFQRLLPPRSVGRTGAQHSELANSRLEPLPWKSFTRCEEVVLLRPRRGIGTSRLHPVCSGVCEQLVRVERGPGRNREGCRGAG